MRQRDYGGCRFEKKNVIFWHTACVILVLSTIDCVDFKRVFKCMKFLLGAIYFIIPLKEASESAQNSGRTNVRQKETPKLRGTNNKETTGRFPLAVWGFPFV